MSSAIARMGVTLALVALLQACGGGGGGGGGGGSGSGPRLTASATTFSESATPGQAAPLRSVVLTVTNPPAAGLFVQIAATTSGIHFPGFEPGVGAGTVNVLFRSPGSMQNGTFNDSITIRVCTDDQCRSQIAGSPVTVTTQYVVSGTGTSTVSPDRSSIQYTTDLNEITNRQEFVQLTLDVAPDSGVFAHVSHTSNAIQRVTHRVATLTLVELDIRFRSGAELGSGDFSDTIDVTLCYDVTCARLVEGSPLTISTAVSVFMPPEPGVPPLMVTSREALPHDVIDAEFSTALNRVVMVGRWPVNALYVYEVATGTEHEQPLAAVPTSVSVAPDGLTAAVGHDGAITVVELGSVGQPGAPAPILLDVSTTVDDVILDGNGYVHAMPRTDTAVAIYSVEIATNTERVSTGSPVHPGSRARLHPSGDYLYTANKGVSPDDIEKWDIRPGAATRLYDSPYHTDFLVCHDLWMHESGSAIYTACGNVFQSSTDPAQDLLQAGALEMYQAGSLPFRIRWLDRSAVRDEIAVIEHDYLRCVLLPGSAPCYTHLAYFDGASLDRLDFFTLAPFRVDGTDYAQQGLFVFHDAVGTEKYVLSKLLGAPSPDQEYYLSIVP